MRRRLWLLLLAACGGCRTVEIAVDYPLAGVHVVAKFESHEKAPVQQTLRDAKATTRSKSVVL
jgi:hypothetical protein